MNCEIKYTERHQWVKKEGEIFLLGVTDYAQDQLGEIEFIDFPKKGATIAKGETLLELESSKAISDIVMPFSGKVADINNKLTDEPEGINKDPLNTWLVKIEAENVDDFKNLLDGEI